MKIFIEGFNINNFDDCVEEFYKVIDRMYHNGLELDDIESAFEKALVEYDSYGSVTEDFDVSDKPKTVGYTILSDEEFKQELNSKLSDAMYKIRPFNQVKREIVDLIQNTKFMANSKQKDEFINRVQKSSSPEFLASVIGAYTSGIPSITSQKRKTRGY